MSNKTMTYMYNNLSDLIYSESVIEGVGASLSQVEDVLENRYSQALESWQIQTLTNLKDAWEHLFDWACEYIDADIVMRYNLLLQRNLNNAAGQIRSGVVFVDTRFGRYYPPASSKSSIRQAIEISWHYTDPVQRSLALLAMIAKGQFFDDGNKRTAQIVANHSLALSDTGVCFCVSDRRSDDFKTILGTYYTDNENLDETVDALSDYLL